MSTLRLLDFFFILKASNRCNRLHNLRNQRFPDFSEIPRIPASKSFWPVIKYEPT